MRYSELYGMIIQKFNSYKGSYYYYNEAENDYSVSFVFAGNADLLALHFRSSIIGQSHLIYVFCEGIMFRYLVR